MRRSDIRFDGATVYAVDTKVFRRAAHLGSPALVRWLPNVTQDEDNIITGHLVGEDGVRTGSLALTSARVIGTWTDHEAEQREIERRKTEAQRAQEAANQRLAAWRDLVISRVGKRNRAIPHWMRFEDVVPGGHIHVQELALLVEAAYTAGMEAGSKAATEKVRA